MNYTVELSNTAEQDIHESVRYVTLQLADACLGIQSTALIPWSRFQPVFQ